MELTAKLVEILPVVTGEGKNGQWKKQNIILETDGQYPKKVCMTVWGDKINLSELKVGSTLKVAYNLESREYNDNWFTDVLAWKIETVGSTPATAPTATPATATSAEGGDDLPF